MFCTTTRCSVAICSFLTSPTNKQDFVGFLKYVSRFSIVARLVSANIAPLCYSGVGSTRLLTTSRPAIFGKSGGTTAAEGSAKCLDRRIGKYFL